jgi:hypothetical protein
VSRIGNDPIALAEEIGKAGECPEVVLEATYGHPGTGLRQHIRGPVPPRHKLFTRARYARATGSEARMIQRRRRFSA